MAQTEVVVLGRNRAMTDCGVGAGFPHIGEVAGGKGSWGQWRQFPPMVSRLAVW
uniref:RAB17, member RAS onco family n=1 Tax=Mandrillus leucophaeus TaxID=9568 RepID=A0A2K6A0R1_MANLE